MAATLVGGALFPSVALAEAPSHDHVRAALHYRNQQAALLTPYLYSLLRNLSTMITRHFYPENRHHAGPIPCFRHDTTGIIIIITSRTQASEPDTY